MKHSNATAQAETVSCRGFLFPPIYRLTACVAPLLPAMVCSGLVKSLLVLLTAVNVLSVATPTSIVLSVIGDAFFYFFPIFLAYSVSKRQGSSSALALLVAAILLHPDLAALMAGGGAAFFGIPLPAVIYPTSVLPIVLTVLLMKPLERLADRLLFDFGKLLLKPILILAFALSAALFFIGPTVNFAGNLLVAGIRFLHERIPTLALLLLTAVYPLILLLGMHSSLLPIAESADPMWEIALFCTLLAECGTSLAVLFRSNDREERQIAIGAAICGAIGGVPEIALYGIIGKRKRWLLTSVLAAVAGCLLAKLIRFPTPFAEGIPTLLSLTPLRGSALFSGLLTAAAILLSAFGLTLLFDFLATSGRPLFRKKASSAPPTNGTPEEGTECTFLSLASPLSGRVIPLSEVKDPAISSGMMGQGCAILPEEGKIYAPFDGTVSTVAMGHHAITIDSNDGVELFIHVGRDTAALDGKYFDLCCKAGDEVREGDLLLSFDSDAIRKDGFDLTTPLLVINADRFDDLSLTCERKVAPGDRLLSFTKRQDPTNSPKHHPTDQ